VRQVVEQVIDAWGGGSWIDQSTETAHAPHEAEALRLDITKAASRLAWHARLSAKQAIERTVAWYRRPATIGTAFNAAQACADDIGAYESLVK
jgi:CDP-glucose 4,6-dehydratase